MISSVKKEKSSALLVKENTRASERTKLRTKRDSGVRKRGQEAAFVEETRVSLSP